MKFAYFPGCKIPYYQPHYGQATKRVLGALGVELAEMEFSCCGYPVRNENPQAFLLTAARNLALAEARGLDIFTPCQCCYGSLRKAQALLSDPAARATVAAELKAEGLAYAGRAKVRHLVQVLAEEIGLPALQAKVTRPLAGLKVAPHYGCHALRPSKVTAFDDPLAPSIMERLVELTGASALAWARRLECCGAPQWGKNDELAGRLMARKLDDARATEAMCLCVACTYCQIQFDTQQAAAPGAAPALPSLFLPQLIGLAMGLPPAELGLDRHQVPTGSLLASLAAPGSASQVA